MYRVITMFAALTFGTCVSAATLQPISGKVLINHGAGYQAITQPAAVTVGTSIMVNAEGSAKLVYNEQCAVAVKPGQVVAVAAEAPCQKTGQPDFESTRMSLGAKCDDKSFCEPPPEDHHWLPIVGLAGAGVVVGLCVGDVICDKDASP